jgi:hypothetical protein
MKNEKLNWLQKMYHNTYSKNRMTAFWNRLGVIMFSFGLFTMFILFLLLFV